LRFTAAVLSDFILVDRTLQCSLLNIHLRNSRCLRIFFTSVPIGLCRRAVA
jgi:hypothetical protein